MLMDLVVEPSMDRLELAAGDLRVEVRDISEDAQISFVLVVPYLRQLTEVQIALRQIDRIIILCTEMELVVKDSISFRFQRKPVFNRRCDGNICKPPFLSLDNCVFR